MGTSLHWMRSALIPETAIGTGRTVILNGLPRTYRYVKNQESANSLTVGMVAKWQGPTACTATGGATSAALGTSMFITSGLVANAWNGAFATCTGTAGPIGETRLIKSNTTVNVYIDVADPVETRDYARTVFGTTLYSTSTAVFNLWRPYPNVLRATAANGELPVGVVPYTIEAGYCGWIQTQGYNFSLLQTYAATDAITINEPIVASPATAVSGKGVDTEYDHTSATTAANAARLSDIEIGKRLGMGLATIATGGSVAPVFLDMDWLFGGYPGEVIGP